jgi:hypothetical protein
VTERHYQTGKHFGRSSFAGQLPVPAIVLLTLVNVWFAREPTDVMAVMQTLTIKASMTAYSTDVGPSSRFKKFATLRCRINNIVNPRGMSSKLENRTQPASAWVGSCACTHKLTRTVGINSTLQRHVEIQDAGGVSD